MSYRKLFYALNIAMMGSFIWSLWVDFFTEWRPYQNKYFAMAADVLEKEGKTAEAKKMRHQWPEIKQILNRDLDRIDRCTTCHVGMDEYVNPTLKNNFTQNPYKAHPNVVEINGKHPFQKYGCTVCHQGQGMGTTVAGAHGRVRNWEQPLLDGKMIQGACVRCHANFEHLKGTEVAAKGKQLFYAHGCQGCHAVRGVGGIISVDLQDIADKPLERIAGYNFKRVKYKGKELSEDDWTRVHWILGHIENDPMEVTPNDPEAKLNAEPIAPSGMPNFTENDATGKREISEEDAEAITTWLMSMSPETKIPHSYYVDAPVPPEPKLSGAAHGKLVFEKYGCAGCHGLHGSKGRRNFNAKGAGQDEKEPVKGMEKGREPTLVDVVGTYTHEELVKKIATGVKSVDIVKFNTGGPTPPLYMPSWKEKIKPDELNDLAAYLLSIAKKQDVGF
ncbi:MAG: c-type cytochrome [Elusimicrobia bacterium]|nr:c-type cytochrome [Elusimicrobiota bacterium]